MRLIRAILFWFIGIETTIDVTLIILEVHRR